MNPFRYIRDFIRDWRENMRTRIVDTSHLKKIPERNPLHLAFTFLFAVSMVAVLWQHCHPFITILILALILPLSLQAYIPYARFGFTGRFIIQLIIVALALVWTFYRIKTGVPIDKTAVEMTGIAITTFLMGRRKRDYGYLFLVCMFLLIYAALLPRILFLLLFAAAVVLTLLILYFNRPINLAGDPELKMPPVKVFRTLPFILFHLGLATLFFFLIFSLLPLRPTRTKGALEVSFLTDKDSFMPQDMQTWLRGDTVKADPHAKRFIRKSNKPDSLGSTGTPINIPNSKTTAKAEGSGSGSPAQGKDLVFSVKSPVKLYHLAQLYDVYDGVAWTISKPLSRAFLRNLSRREQLPGFFDAELQYTVLKWISPKLFAPFMPVLFNTLDNPDHIRITQQNYFSAELYGRSYPRTPFKYKVSIRMVLPQEQVRREGEKTVIYWQERLPRGHYKRLPPKKISKRLRELVKKLTQDKNTDYEKAIALRDYLRTTFPYKLYAKKSPKEKESTDYFIFELKEGHCEYFATALTIMARLAKLPARVATGFSPGNYNTLTSQFDVYEYHAHAWTQIFIEDKGWLTFDATPPSAIPSQTTPLGIGMLRDPFGDEWRISPPEMTQASVNFVKNAILEAENEKKEEVSKFEEMVASALTKEETKAVKTVKKENKKAPPKKTWVMRTNEFLKQFNLMLGKSISSLKTFFASNWKIVLPSLVLLLTCLAFLRVLQVFLRQKRLMRNARLFMSEARDKNRNNVERFRSLYFAARANLKLANLGRHRNQELMAYANLLRKTNPELADNAAAVFAMFYRIEYGGYVPDSFEMDDMISRGERIHEILIRINSAKK